MARVLLSDEELYRFGVVKLGERKTTNQFLGQAVATDELILTFGHFAPPPLLGTLEERMEQARQLTFIPVQALARFGMIRARLEELRGVIEQTLENHDKLVGEGSS